MKCDTCGKQMLSATWCNHCGTTRRHITVNHVDSTTFTYFTDMGVNKAHVYRNKRNGTVRLVGSLTNKSWNELIMASEQDAFSVKGSW